MLYYYDYCDPETICPIQNSTKVFKLLEKIQGPKKPRQEACAILDPHTKEQIVDPEKIKEVSLQYCQDVLRDNVPKEEFVKELEMTHAIHEDRCDEEEGEEEFTTEDFEAAVTKFKNKKKKVYDFITKSGDALRRVVGKLCVRILNNEEIPGSFDLTTLTHSLKSTKVGG